MNGFKSDVVKYIICGLLVFSIGLFIGKIRLKHLNNTINIIADKMNLGIALIVS